MNAKTVSSVPGQDAECPFNSRHSKHTAIRDMSESARTSRREAGIMLAAGR